MYLAEADCFIYAYVKFCFYLGPWQILLLQCFYPYCPFCLKYSLLCLHRAKSLLSFKIYFQFPKNLLYVRSSLLFTVYPSKHHHSMSYMTYSLLLPYRTLTKQSYTYTYWNNFHIISTWHLSIDSQKQVQEYLLKVIAKRENMKGLVKLSGLSTRKDRMCW